MEIQRQDFLFGDTVPDQDRELIGPFWPYHDIHEERHHLRFMPGCNYLMPE